MMPADPAQFEQVKGFLSQQLLQERQRRYLRAWVEEHLRRADVKDERPEILESS